MSQGSKTKIKSKQRSSERHALMVWRSSQHIYAVVYGPNPRKALFGVSTLTPSIKKQIKKGASKTDQAKLVGAEIAKVAQEKGIKIVCFDRNGFIYHGRIRALAEAARDAGLDF